MLEIFFAAIVEPLGRPPRFTVGADGSKRGEDVLVKIANNLQARFFDRLGTSQLYFSS